jgi:hypothetical protein
LGFFLKKVEKTEKEAVMQEEDSPLKQAVEKGISSQP